MTGLFLGLGLWASAAAILWIEHWALKINASGGA